MKSRRGRQGARDKAANVRALHLAFLARFNAYWQNPLPPFRPGANFPPSTDARLIYTKAKLLPSAALGSKNVLD